MTVRTNTIQTAIRQAIKDFGGAGTLPAIAERIGFPASTTHYNLQRMIQVGEIVHKHQLYRFPSESERQRAFRKEIHFRIERVERGVFQGQFRAFVAGKNVPPGYGKTEWEAVACLCNYIIETGADR